MHLQRSWPPNKFQHESCRYEAGLRHLRRKCVVLRHSRLLKVSFHPTSTLRDWRLISLTSSQVSKHLATLNKGTSRPMLLQGGMAETKLSSLSLRLHQPYAIFHAGNCEHFIVVEQIRYDTFPQFFVALRAQERGQIVASF